MEGGTARAVCRDGGTLGNSADLRMTNANNMSFDDLGLRSTERAEASRIKYLA